MNAAEFNARYPVGTLVFAYPGCRPEDGAGTRLVTRTRTEAQLSASGDPVVWVEGEGAYICLTHVDPVAEDVWEAARKTEKQAEPETPSVPARLSPEREAEIAARHEGATPGPWSANAQIGVVTNEAGDPLAVFGGGEQDRADAAFVAAAREDVPALLAELAAVRTERDQARADSERSRAAHFHEAARLLEDTGHDDDAVNLLDTLADGIHTEAENASDNRRRLFVDGKGNGWISVCHDEGTEWIVPVQSEAAVEQDVRDVADETGSLREIGRCW